MPARKAPSRCSTSDEYLEGAFIKTLPQDIRDGIAEHGIRNALADIDRADRARSASMQATSRPGIEPIFAFSYNRKVLQKDGSKTEEEVIDYAIAKWREINGEADLPDYIVSAQTLTPLDHVRMQAVAQKFVDSSISKTINVPEDISFDAFQDVYTQAYAQGCKGCTTYRPNAVTGTVLEVSEPAPATSVQARNSTGAKRRRRTDVRTA